MGTPEEEARNAPSAKNTRTASGDQGAHGRLGTMRVRVKQVQLKGLGFRVKQLQVRCFRVLGSLGRMG